MINLKKEKYNELIGSIKSNRDAQKCLKYNMDIISQQIAPDVLINAIKNIQEFSEWKIDKLSSLACLVCSTASQNYYKASDYKLTLYVNSKVCLQDAEKNSLLDNVANLLIRILYLIKGIHCKERKIISNELNSLPSLSLKDWKPLLDKKNKCIASDGSGFRDPNCHEGLNMAPNVTLFPQFTYLNTMSEFAFVELEKILNFETDIGQTASYVTDHEKKFLNEETILENSMIEFNSYPVYSQKAQYPMFFETICSLNGIYLNRYQMVKENIKQFKKTLQDAAEKEAKENNKKLDMEIAAQYEDSLLDESETIYLLRNVFIVFFILSFK
jgi:hypothetical protein